MLNKKKKIDSIRSRSVEYAQFGMFQLISRVMYVCFACILIGSFWFLYTRMYKTIGQVESITAISPLANVQVLNMNTYDKVKAELQEKSSKSAPVLVRDPFNANTVRIPTEETSSSVESTTTLDADTDTSFTQNL